MAEVLVSFREPVAGADGSLYAARACGGEMDDGRWQGWIEFERLDGSETLRSPRETTQPNRTDAAYWATGLTAVYLEGALERAFRPMPLLLVEAPAQPAFDGPRAPGDAATAAHNDAVLNPFSVFRKGEALLRRQLMAFERWHLVNIIRAFELSGRPSEALNRMTLPELIELIVSRVRDAAETQP